MKRKYITPAIENEKMIGSFLMDVSLIYAGGNEDGGPTVAESKEISDSEWGSLW